MVSGAIDLYYFSLHEIKDTHTKAHCDPMMQMGNANVNAYIVQSLIDSQWYSSIVIMFFHIYAFILWFLLMYHQNTRTVINLMCLNAWHSFRDNWLCYQACCALRTVYPKKYAHGFCFAVLCCGYTLTDFPKSIRLTSLALWQSNDCSSASKATLMNMDKYFMWIHYERLHNHNKAKHNKTVCIFLGIYCKGH